MRKLLRITALSAFFVAAVTALAACGGDSIPGNAVAKVGDSTITKSQFDHWMTIAAKSSQQQTSATTAAVQIPKPPEFTECVANKTKTAPKPAKGQPKQTPAQFKSQCKQEYENYRNQVMQFLISASWLQGESADQGVKVTDAEVTKSFNTTKKQSFPKDADFQAFLKSSGMTIDDVKFRVKVDSLSTKLRTKITKGKDVVTDKAIAAYYAKNKKRFAAPERRDMRIVLTKTEAKANEAKSALEAKGSWKAIAKKYSIDQASKNAGGVLLAVSKGQQEKALDDAVFAAKTGQLSGPIKTQFGYYVFEVTKITPASQQTLAQAKPTIKQLLQSEGQQKALDSFVKDFQAKWKKKTNCQKDFVTQDCKNAPKVKTTTAGATTPATTTG